MPRTRLRYACRMGTAMTQFGLLGPMIPLTFPDRVDRVEATYVQIVKEIHAGEEVNLFVLNEETKKKATAMFKEADIDLNRVHYLCFRLR